MPNRLSEYMSDRMPEIMSEYMPNRMSVGGDHSKEVISQITIKLENHVITFQITHKFDEHGCRAHTFWENSSPMFSLVCSVTILWDRHIPKWPFGQCTNLRVIMRGTTLQRPTYTGMVPPQGFLIVVMIIWTWQWMSIPHDCGGWIGNESYVYSLVVQYPSVKNLVR